MRFNLLIFILFSVALQLSAQQTFTVNIDFGGSTTTLPWNTLTSSSNGSATGLWAMNGQQTSLDIEVFDAFNGTNFNGETSTSFGFPAFASEDSYFGNTEEFNGTTEATGGVRVTGLDVNKFYAISLFASRTATDNRETQYYVQAANKDTLLFLDVASNVDRIVSVADLIPFNDGSITVEATKGPNNNNVFGFFYLGIMSISYEDIFIPVEQELELTSPNGGEFWQKGQTPEIRWNSQGIFELILEYSLDAGASWSTIDTISAFSQKYAWTVPDDFSSDCLVRINSDSLSDLSDAAFEINNEDTTSCLIVVLGSSTAAGTGPTSLDQAWVWMYRDTLYQTDTRFSVMNLARGGFTTYDILPDDAEIPSTVNETIDTTRNITEALSLNPQAIIINLPSNDAANGYTVETQLENYDTMLDEVDLTSIPVWICTPQPRNNFNATQKQIQLDLRDSTFNRFSDFAIDFWTGLEDGNANVDPAFDSGDGVHLNNEGHDILLQRVLGAGVRAFLLDDKISPVHGVADVEIEKLNIYPNPSSGFIHVKDIEPPFIVTYYDVHGRIVSQFQQDSRDTLRLPLSGQQYVLVTKDEKHYGAWVVRE